MTPPPVWVTTGQERTLLENCLREAKRRLDHYRAIGDELMRDITEADVNRMLEELARIYKRPFGRTPMR